MTSDQTFDVVIIGAGLSAIILARKFSGSVCLLEKSKGLGGRVATRRLGTFSADHGPRELIPKHPWLKEAIEVGLASGTLKIQGEAVVGVKGFSPWIKKLAAPLQIRREALVHRFVFSANGVEVFDEKNQPLARGKELVLSCPAPQAKAILERSGVTVPELSQVSYSSAVQGLCILTSPLDPNAALFRTWSVGRHIEISEGHFYHLEFKGSFPETAKEEIQAELRDQLTRSGATVVELHVHKWRYSEVTTPLSAAPRLSQNHLHLMGDYLGGSDANAAAASAERLLTQIGRG